MKFLYATIFILLCINLSLGQTQEDFKKAQNEVERILNNEEKDSTKVNLLHTNCNKTMYTSPKLAEIYNEAAFELAKSKNYKKGIGWSLLYKCVLNIMQGNYDKALAYNKKALALAEKFQLNNLLANVKMNRGNIYLQQGAYEKAIKTLEETAIVYEEIGNKGGVVGCYVNVAFIYKNQGLLVKALSYYQKSLTIAEELQKQNYVLACHTGMGNIYVRQNNFDKALKSYQTALKISKEIQNQRGIANAYGNIGNLYYKQENYSKALVFHKKCLSVNEKINNQPKVVLVNYNIADSYRHLDKQEESKKHYDIALDLAKKLKLIPDIINIKIGLGYLYTKQNKPRKAIEELEEAYKLAKDINYQESVRGASRILAENYEKVRDFENSYKYQRIFNTVNDSLLNEDNIRELVSLDKDFEFEQERKITKIKQEKEKALQKAKLAQEQTRQRYLWIGIILVVLFAIHLFYNNRKRLQKNKILALQKEEIKLQAEELQLQSEELKTVNETLVTLDNFKEQMTGMMVHDLKNPLNSVIALSENENLAQKEHQIIHQSGQQMLTMVSNMLDVYKFEESEIQLDLEKTSLSEITNLALSEVGFLAKQKSLTILNEIQAEYLLHIDIELIKRVFVNIFTNAIKYSSNNSKIWLKVEDIENQTIKIFIQDEGIGIPKAQQAKIFEKFSQVEARQLGKTRSTGLGLTFCKMVVEAHNGQIGVMSEEGKGTSFWFTIEANQLNESSQTMSELSNPSVIQSFDNSVTQSFNYSFTRQEEEYLKTYIKELQNLELYEASKIMHILENLRKQASPNIQKWAKELENTVFTYNEDTYKRLINT